MLSIYEPKVAKRLNETLLSGARRKELGSSVARH